MNTRTKFKYLAVGIFIISILISILIAIDMYYHNKYLEFAGLNHKGYRGKVVGKKEKDEIRIVIVGGCTAFGYGLHYRDTIPAVLENKLQEYCDTKISVVNLAYNTVRSE